MSAGDVDRLISILETGRARAMRDASRSLEIVLCYEVGYDGFWLARLLMARGIRTVVFDPASFLKPRRGRLAKTDRLDAEEMTHPLNLAFRRSCRCDGCTHSDGRGGRCQAHRARAQRT